MSEVSSVDRLATLRANRIVRAEKEASRRDTTELMVLELEEKFESEGLRRGHDFEIIEDGLDVPIVVKRVAGVVFKKWKSEPSSEQSTTDLISACIVHPKLEEFNVMAMNFPPLRDRAEVAIAALYKAKVRGDAGKF